MPQASQPGSSSACCCNNPPNKPDTLEFRRACVWGPTGTDYAPPQTHENMPRSTPNWIGTVSQDHMMLQEAIGVQGGAPPGVQQGGHCMSYGRHRCTQPALHASLAVCCASSASPSCCQHVAGLPSCTMLTLSASQFGIPAIADFPARFTRNK